MRRRLYFVSPDENVAGEIFKELRRAGIEERDIHVLAKQGSALEYLRKATVPRKSDTLHGIELGLIFGGATGMLAGIVAVLFPPSGLAMGLGVIFTTAVVGAIMGVWISGIIAADVPSIKLKKFSRALEQGKVLVIVDIPKARVDEVTRIIQKHHPEADMRGLDPSIPAFP